MSRRSSRPDRHGRSWLAPALVLLLAVVVLGGTGLAHARFQDEVRRATDVQPIAPQPVAEPPVMLVVGDSFTAGTEFNSGQEWGERTAAALGWYFFKDAVGGTGYVSGSNSAPTFGRRIGSDLKSYAPDVVVIAGGRNDLEFAVDDVARAAGGVVNRAKRGFKSDPEVVLLSPFASGAPDSATLALTAALRQVAERQNVDFLDVSDALADDSGQYIARDGVHPTDAGQAVLALAVEDGLRGLGYEPFTP